MTMNNKIKERCFELVKANYRDSLEYMTTLINSYTNEVQDSNYWDIICGNWLERFLGYIAIAVEVEEDLLMPVKTDQVFSPAVFIDCFRLKPAMKAIDAETCYQNIYSLIKAIRSEASLPPNAIKRELVTFDLHYKSSLGERLLRFLSTSDKDVLVNMPCWKTPLSQRFRFAFRNRSWLKCDQLEFSYSTQLYIDWEWRLPHELPIINENQKDLYNVLVRLLLPIYIPAFVLEGWVDFKKFCLAQNVNKPSLFYTANSLHHHLLSKVLVAEWKKCGTRVLIGQHGGMYGMGSYVPAERFELRCADQYYSWGWTKSIRGKHISVLGPPTSLLKPRIWSSKSVLLVMTDLPKDYLRLDSSPMGSEIGEMHQIAMDFCRLYQRPEKLVVRPYFIDYGWRELEELNSPAGHYDVDRYSKINKLFSRCGICIHSYLGTSFLQTLSSGIPTLLLMRIEHYCLDSATTEALVSLRKCGILHSSPESALNMLSNLNGNYLKWWNREEVQHRVNDFCARYAAHTEESAKEWGKELKCQLVYARELSTTNIHRSIDNSNHQD